jgi:hypothetical protein
VTDDGLDDLLRQFGREAGGLVRVPGTDDVRRTVLRRQRLRLGGAVSAASLAVVAALSVYMTTATRAPTLAPASPSAQSAPSSSASPALPATRGVPGSPFGSPTEALATTVDLRVSGPASAVLTVSGGHYQATINITVHNDGLTPYQNTGIFVSYPAGVQIDFSRGQPFGPCVVVAAPDSVRCDADAVPAGGGQITYAVPLRADYAPQPQGLTLSGFGVRVEATDNAGSAYPDLTPSDNSVAIELVLKATG